MEAIASIGEHLDSSEPSPCAGCSRLFEDKDRCSERCTALVKWQVESGALSKPKRVQAIKRIMRNGIKRCMECGGELRCEDHVIYCAACLKVHMRLAGKDPVKEVGYLLDQNWTVEQIQQILKLGKEYTMELAKANGVEFQQWATHEEKAQIVDYMIEHGSAKAAQRYGLHPGTINAYARQFNLGTKERYERLKLRAKELFKAGDTKREVSEKLGVDYKTAWAWSRKLGGEV